MGAPQHLDADGLRAALPMKRAVEVVHRAFAGELPTAPPRSHLDLGGAEMLLMPAWGAAAAGVKVVTVAPENPSRDLPLIQGLYVLFDRASLTPVATIDGAALTALRTAAVSGAAARALAPRPARHLVIFGAGTQAHSHLEAMVAVRDVERVTVVSRTPERAADLAAKARDRGPQASVGDPTSVEAADLVCTCTTSATPVFDGSLLPATCHVTAVGAYKPDRRELDDETLRRASRVVVEQKDVAGREAGDVVMALESGALRPGRLAELADVLAAPQPAGPDGHGITVFKSVGAAFEDLVVAGAALGLL